MRDNKKRMTEDFCEICNENKEYLAEHDVWYCPDCDALDPGDPEDIERFLRGEQRNNALILPCAGEAREARPQADNRMSSERLDAIRVRVAEGATEDWTGYVHGDGALVSGDTTTEIIYNGPSLEVAALIANAPADLRALLAEVEAAREQEAYWHNEWIDEHLRADELLAETAKLRQKNAGLRMYLKDALTMLNAAMRGHTLLKGCVQKLMLDARYVGVEVDNGAD